MALLELVAPEPDWLGALEVVLTRPPGTPERRRSGDLWTPPDDIARPRRISDDLAWLRQAIEEPARHGLRPIGDTAAVGVWEPEHESLARLLRLRDRGILDAAGFLLHEHEAPPG